MSGTIKVGLLVMVFCLSHPVFAEIALGVDIQNGNQNLEISTISPHKPQLNLPQSLIKVFSEAENLRYIMRTPHYSCYDVYCYSPVSSINFCNPGKSHDIGTISSRI
ncbi:hypothetical protein Trydic_g11411 [Trypoxylus dichotomus]